MEFPEHLDTADMDLFEKEWVLSGGQVVRTWFDDTNYFRSRSSAGDGRIFFEGGEPVAYYRCIDDRFVEVIWGTNGWEPI